MAEPDDRQAMRSNDGVAPASWAVVVNALETFQVLHGHVDVPADFDVPMTATWPVGVHGLQLGRLVASLRTHSTLNPERKATLDALGFKWDPKVQRRCQRSWEHRFEAMCLYREEHGHVKVPQSYVVPASYPRHLHRLPLGNVVQHLRTLTYDVTPAFIRKRCDLDALGFLWRQTRNATFCEVRRPGKPVPRSQLVPWPDQIQALLVFRRLHGHAIVPDGFVVPAESHVWPLPMRHVALDLALASLRSHAYELADADADRLRDAGYFADLPDFSTFVQLLQLYYNAFGTGAVRIDFVVPQAGGHWIDVWRGFALGELAWSVGLKVVVLTLLQRNDLKCVKFVFNVDATWARILCGLQHFVYLYGALAIPTTFVAPHSWPLDVVGLPLGRYVERMRTAKRLRLLPPATAATFTALTPPQPARTVLWTPPRDATQTRWVVERLREMLRVVRDVYDTVPYDLVVPPSGIAWPPESHGVPLGACLHWFEHQVARHLSLPVSDDVLADAGNVITDEVPPITPPPIPPMLSRKWTLHDRVCALGFYRHLHGDADVPTAYPVPTAPPWPSELHNLQVATFAHSLRHHSRRLDEVLEEKLKLIGFSGPTFVATSRCVKRRAHGTLVVRPAPIVTQVAALCAYQDLVGDLRRMPNDFTVPLHDARWPRGSSEMVLSCLPRSLRYHWFELTAADEASVRALGLFADVPPFDDFVQLVSRFTSTGQTTVPLDFVVPSEWSTQWCDAPLGELAWSLGVRRTHLATRKSLQLTAIGFDFNTPATWARIVDGLHMHRSLYDSTDVDERFVVPHSARWPARMHGMRLGHWARLLVAARELYLLPHTTAVAVDALRADASLQTVTPSLFGGANTAAPAVPATFSAVQASSAPLLVAVASSPVAQLLPAPEAATDARYDHRLALDVWLQATPRPSESTLLGALSPSCPVALRSVSVGAFLLELEVGQAFAALDVRPLNRHARWAIKFQALTLFKALHGHLCVPRAFTVEANVAWPRTMHGLRLGIVVLGLRRLQAGNILRTIVEQLDALGFEWADVPDVLLASAPQLPSVGPVPMTSLQDANASGSDRSALSHLLNPVEDGFDWDGNERSDLDGDGNKSDIMDLLRADDDVDGHDHDGDVMDAMPLGVRGRQNDMESVASVRRKLVDGWVVPPRGRPVFQRAQRLVDTFPWSLCLDALRRYFEKHAHSNVPLTYVSDGVPLGRLVRHLRQGGAIVAPSSERALQALEFDWMQSD